MKQRRKRQNKANHVNVQEADLISAQGKCEPTRTIELADKRETSSADKIADDMPSSIIKNNDEKDPDYLSIINEYIDQFNTELHGPTCGPQVDRDSSPSSLIGFEALVEDVGSNLLPSWSVTTPECHVLPRDGGQIVPYENDHVLSGNSLFLAGSAPQPTLQEQLYLSAPPITNIRISNSCKKQLANGGYSVADSRLRHRSDGLIQSSTDGWQHDLLPRFSNMRLQGFNVNISNDYSDMKVAFKDTDSAYFTASRNSLVMTPFSSTSHHSPVQCKTLNTDLALPIPAALSGPGVVEDRSLLRSVSMDNSGSGVLLPTSQRPLLPDYNCTRKRENQMSGGSFYSAVKPVLPMATAHVPRFMPFSRPCDPEEMLLKQIAARQPTEKGNRACSFHLRGHCKKEDCQFAHDLRQVVCRFWAESECFKGDACPFRHRPLDLESPSPTASASSPEVSGDVSRRLDV